MRTTPAPFERKSALERALSFRHLEWIRVDWHILLVALALLCFGLFFVYHMDVADREFGRVDDEIDFGKHLQKVLITLPMLLVGLLIKSRWLRRNATAVYVAAMGLLLLVPVFGIERNSAKRWLKTPIGFDLQPSELAKLGLIIVLARVLYTCRLTRWSDWTRPCVVALIPMALVALQPDLGTAMTIPPIAIGMFYVAGAPAKRIFGVAASILVVFALAVHFEWIRDYQLERVRTWTASLSPELLKEGKNGPAFHTYHARVAIGNGGWFGQGLGRGIANEAAHLPERESDSIFAVIAEESGFIGTSGLLLLYALLIVLLLAAASSIRERFARLVVCGIGLYFAAHAFVNVGVNLGVIPMTGLTLPLFSTGGSSMMVTFAALGLALGLSAQREATLDEDAFRA